MAFFSATQATGPSIGARIARVRDDIRAALEQRRIYTTTLNELSALTSRELADLGIDRSNIQSVAYQAAYGAK